MCDLRKLEIAERLEKLTAAESLVGECVELLLEELARRRLKEGAPLLRVASLLELAYSELGAVSSGFQDPNMEPLVAMEW